MPRKKDDIPDGIICLWQLKKPENRTGTRGYLRLSDTWDLIEVYPIDDDGRPTGDTINVDGSDRQPHRGWMRKPYELRPEDKREEIDEDETEDAMGRAVTLWTMSGVELLDFHPETWESVEMFRFHELLKILRKKWTSVFEFGYEMEQATIAEAYKVLFK